MYSIYVGNLELLGVHQRDSLGRRNNLIDGCFSNQRSVVLT